VFEEFILTTGTAHKVAGTAQWAAVRTQGVQLLKLEATEWAGYILSHRPRWFTIPPTKNANGKMKLAMLQATFIPCSFAIIRKLAKHGMNSVIVTIATKIWC